MSENGLCIGAEQPCNGIKGVFPRLCFGNNALDAVYSQSLDVVGVVGDIHKEGPYLIVVPSVRESKAQIAYIRLEPAGLHIACVVIAGKVHLAEPVCEGFPPSACDILSLPCLLVHGDNMTEFVCYGQVVKHCLGADYLYAVAVLSAHERPAVGVLVKSRIGQVHIGLVLLCAPAVDVNVHILHAEKFAVAFPELLVILQITLEKGVVDLSRGVIVAVENYKVF